MDSYWLYNFSFRQLISLQSLYNFITRFPVIFADVLLSMYFRYCGLARSSVHLDDNQTIMHIWGSKRREYNKANLVLIHGFGGNSKWQFLLQIRQLARDFNVYVPDLVFFGESYSSNSDRSIGFQAKCVCDGLKKMRVDKFSVYAISYGGFVGYRMAEVYDDMVEKLVIVSSGIVCKHDRKLEHVKKIGRSVVDLLVAKTPEDLRMLCRISIHKYDIGRWIPDFFLWGFIGLECCGKEKEELVHELLNEKHDVDLPILTQVDDDDNDKNDNHHN
ncbi:Alpha/beta hydrolase fold-1 [Artemisia annua]|uniref:Alpha/beta hydrolase fold-1 n=1 Tax=Artemisia annua TaxID=35608 RepID=A0A2U1KZ85_ARTAN|nr:Alpha/beta hydrolase fold-1 [Artemisia annua]